MSASASAGPGSGSAAARQGVVNRLFFPARRSDQVDALDGLRGIAVLIVVFSHLSNSRLHVVPGLDLAGIGKSGVFLFFVLSAFLLTRPMLGLEPVQVLEPRRLLSYFLRRFLRIAPLYSIVLLTHTLVSEASRRPIVPPMDAPLLVEHLTLRAGISVYWAIPVEVTFYGVLPLLALGLALAGRGGSRARLAGVWGITLAAAIWTPTEAARGNSIALAPYLSAFLIGITAAVLSRELEARVRNVSGRTLAIFLESAAWLCLSVGVLLVPSLWSAATGSAVRPDHFHGQVVAFSTLWAIVLIGALHGRGALRRMLEWKPLRWVGVVSFSLYLWHMMLLQALLSSLRSWPGLVLALLILGLSLVAAGVSFLLIERPFLHSKWVRSALRRLS
ncbi:MAG: acyltransferase family protein [Myxococcota bacterium]